MRSDPLLDEHCGGKPDRALIRLWIYRCLIRLHTFRDFVDDDGFSRPELAETLGIHVVIDEETGETNKREMHRETRKLLAKAELDLDCDPRGTRVTGALAANVRALQTLLDLSEIECRILEFATLVRYSRALASITDLLQSVSANHALRILGHLLNDSEADIRAAFGPRSTFLQSGLLTLGNDYEYCYLRERFQLPTGDFGQRFLESEHDVIELLGSAISRCPPATLSLKDYDHLGDMLTVTRAYLEQSLATGRIGVNILLWGPPGTGKTQLTRTLAAAHNAEVLEVAMTTPTGEPMAGTARLQAYRAAQAMLRQPHVLLVFDEAEDVFGDWGLMNDRGVAAHKGWFNHILESNRVPTLWTANDIEALDPAFVRRFDLIIELPVPPREKREAILLEHCGDLLSPTALRQLARHNALAPAVVARAASVIKCAQDRLSTEAQEQQLERQLQATLRAQGIPQPRSLLKTDTFEFDPAFVNTNCQLDGVRQHLHAGATSRLLFEGPPGTGKSAAARWIADAMQQHLYILRTSDIVSTFVGETERNLAKIFRVANDESAIIVLDEIDSLLADRRHARHQWEITAVNELLAQIDDYGGSLIGTTNFAARLDEASERRFDLRVQFDYLTATQSWQLFEQSCRQLGLTEPQDTLTKAPLARCHHLTPGDFTKVKRRHRIAPFSNTRALADALVQQNMAKQVITKLPIGFTH